MRLFIAINLPTEVKKELKKAQDSIPEAKLSKTKDFHLTLKFLGETENKDEIIQRLKKIYFKPFRLYLDSIGTFSDKNKIKVIWAGIKENKDLKQLQINIEEVFPEFKKDFDFHPHLTLARVKHIENNEDFEKKLNKIKIEKLEFEVKDFRLISSKLTPKGPVYNTLEEFN